MREPMPTLGLTTVLLRCTPLRSGAILKAPVSYLTVAPRRQLDSMLEPTTVRLRCTSLLLLDRGADVNARDIVGKTPLHMAASGSERTAVVELLINRGAEVDAETKSGVTALDLAKKRGDEALIELLKAHSAGRT
jgi:hypothetical protein